MATGTGEIASPPTSPARPQLRVFISYSHDSEEHSERVFALACQLRTQGVDARIDRQEPLPKQGWPRWMLHQLKRANFVLCVCTETYRRRFEGEEEPGVGKGVTWEGLIAHQLLYDTRLLQGTQFIPIVLDAGANDSIPLLLKPFTSFEYPREYDKLYTALIRAGEPVPELGPRAAVSSGLPDLAADRSARKVLEHEFRKLEWLRQLPRIAIAALVVVAVWVLIDRLIPPPPRPLVTLGITAKDSIVLANEGEADAKLRRSSFAAWVDDQPVADWSRFLEQLGIYQEAEYGWPEFLPRGKRKAILKVRGMDGGLAAYAEHMAFEFCYCRERGDCWVVTWKAGAQETEEGSCTRSARFNARPE